MKAYNREYPTTTDNCLDTMSSTKNGKHTQKEAFKILLMTPELLDPLLFLLSRCRFLQRICCSYEEQSNQI
ncbi:hypothetical protein [Metabacillus idriensis]|uniref:hypothetical protein n=1 Tax=Metabacillus idriensis TaxID=324768 RepID=UPI003D2B7167